MQNIKKFLLSKLKNKEGKTSSLLMNKRVRTGYNLAAKNYNSYFRDQFKNEKHLQWLVNFLPKGATILDLGCGAGKPVDSFLIANSIKVIGVDISEEQIKLARKLVQKATYFVKDMSKIESNHYKVDAVVSFYAIFHTPREKHFELLKKINTFIKPGGFLLVTMGVKDWEGKEDNFCGAEMYWSHYGKSKNLQLISGAGFKILKSEIDYSFDEEHLIVFARKI
jgi:cyclopropane fatty-acyl-phospholipid synthase-like methyltransferase